MRFGRTLVLLLFLGISFYTYSGDLDYVRDTFYLAVEDPQYTDSLKEWFQDKGQSLYRGEAVPVFRAYEAAVTGLQGKHAVLPLTKLKYVNQAIDGMEETADRYPQVIEVRFLRFSFYEQLPAFFSVRNKSSLDLDYLITALDRLAGSPEDSDRVPGKKIRKS
mgnify:CR=1 FL=1